MSCHVVARRINNFSLDPDVKDAWGLPALRMTYRDHPNDMKFMEWMVERAMEILDAAGAKTKWHAPIIGQQFAVHLLGTCRMGNDPKTSVINPDHRAHDVPNSLPVRRQQPGYFRPWPAHDDHPGAGLPRSRPHHRACEAGRSGAA